MRTGSRVIVAICVLALLSGCATVKPVHPVSIDQGKICVSPKYLNKNMAFVEVLTKNETAHPKRVPMVTANSTLTDEMKAPGPFSIVWTIKAISPIPAKDLQIIPGTVPQGLCQHVPNSSGRFKPAEGQEYYVVMKLGPADDPFYATDLEFLSS